MQTKSKTPVQTTAPNPEPKLGFTRFAELWNGRLAMIGFVSAILVEMATGQGILGQLGIM